MTENNPQSESATNNSAIYTVLGPISAGDMGFTLPHEHIMVDFGGAETAGKHRYDAQEIIEVMLPYLLDIAAQGVRTFIDCTPNFLGRDVEIYRQLSEKSGLHIITNTGLYNNQYCPRYAQEQLSGVIAAGWIQEFASGIGDSGIKPGFIKTAVNLQPDAIDLKLIEAAALTHRATGLTIATHTCTADAAEQVIRVLDRFQVDLSRWIFVHAHQEADVERLLELAAVGVWIELDGLGFGGDEDHASKLLTLLDHGYADQVLLSQDAGWYHIGEEAGGEVVGFTRLKTEFLPMLRDRGLDDQTINKITTLNPGRAFASRPG